MDLGCMLRSVRVTNHFSDTLNFCPFNFRKIRVNSIDLGGTETEGAYALGVMGSEFEKRIVSQTPLGRFGRPEDGGCSFQTG
jgi:NAD(P)-dependent dehydrogenase (short-subunit alcohol dehydrogenase family)